MAIVLRFALSYVVFDADKFYKNKKKLYATVAALRKNNPYYNDAYHQIINHGGKIPGFIYRSAVVLGITWNRLSSHGLKFVLRAIKRKV